MDSTLVLPIKPPTSGVLRAARLFLSSPAPKTPKSQAPAPSPVLIDHMSFPHIIDEILAAAPTSVLMRFRATSRKYYLRITPVLASRITVVPIDSKHRHAIGCAAERKGLTPLFPLHTAFPPLPRRLFLDTLVLMLASKWWSKRPVPPPSPIEDTSISSDSDSDSDWGSFTGLHIDPAIPSRIDLGPMHVSLRPAPLLSYTRVLDIDAHVPPSTLMALAESLARQARIVPLVRILFFPPGGWRTTCPIVSRTLVVFLAAIPCPSDHIIQEPVPALVPYGTRRVVFTASGEHMVSYPNLNAIYELPKTVTEVVIHLTHAPAHLACPAASHGAGYAHLGVVIGNALTSVHCRILIVIPNSLLRENPENDAESIPNLIMDAAPHAFPADLSPEDEDKAYARIAFMTDEAYIAHVGEQQWLWESRQ